MGGDEVTQRDGVLSAAEDKVRGQCHGRTEGRPTYWRQRRNGKQCPRSQGRRGL